MANVLLVRLPYEGVYSSFHRKGGKIRSMPPLGLMYIAASLEKSGHQAEILDLEVDSLNEDELKRKLIKKGRILLGLLW